MYVLCVGKVNGSVKMYGPFPSMGRALAYFKAVENAEPDQKFRCYVKELITPYAVVKNVVWR